MNVRNLALAGFLFAAACGTPTEQRDADATPNADASLDAEPGTPDTGPPPTCRLDSACSDPGCMRGTCRVCDIADGCGHDDQAVCYDRMELQLTNRGCLNADEIRAAWAACPVNCTDYLVCRDDASASCVCPEGQVFCNTSPVAYCIDRQTDDLNCGACGNICRDGRVCVAGICMES